VPTAYLILNDVERWFGRLTGRDAGDAEARDPDAELGPGAIPTLEAS